MCGLTTNHSRDDNSQARRLLSTAVPAERICATTQPVYPSTEMQELNMGFPLASSPAVGRGGPSPRFSCLVSCQTSSAMSLATRQANPTSTLFIFREGG